MRCKLLSDKRKHCAKLFKYQTSPILQNFMDHSLF